MLSVTDLKVQYSGSSNYALKGITFNAKKGQLILIAGASGSGKSTLAQAILGLIPNYIKSKIKGQITIDEKSIWEMDRLNFLSKVGYIPQYPSDFITSLLTEEEIAFPLENMATPPAEIDKRINELMKLLNILNLKNRLIPELSSGELQRVELATAIANKPTIIVLDEPIARIDPLSEEQIAQNLKAISEKGHIVLVFEHRLDYLIEVADRLIVLDKGKIVYDGVPSEVVGELKNIDLPEITEISKILLDEIHTNIDESKEKFVEKFKVLKEKLETDIGSNDLKALPVLENQLIFNDVSFHYPQTKNNIFNGVNFSIKKGELVGLLGVNGSGKSTLLRLITGSLKPSRGKIELDGIKKVKIGKTRKKIVYIPENAKLFLVGPTPRDDLVKTKKNIDDAIQMLKTFSFAHLIDRKLYHMSEGERRLMSIFTAFHMNKPIILLDEPTIGLDYNGRKLFFECMKKAKKEGKSVIIATNDQRIFPYFDRILVLSQRQLLLNGKPKEVLYQLEDKTSLVPNQLVRLIRRLERETNNTFPHIIKVEDIKSALKGEN